MKPKTCVQYLRILPVMLLVACGSAVGRPTATIDIPAIATQVAGTAVAQMTQTAAPTITITPWPTATTTPTYTPFPTTIPLPPYTLKGLRAAYIVGGNLYVQDSGGDLTQLTDKGETRSPLIFSDDGQEIVFDEGDYPKPQEAHAINADGSDEHTIVSASLLAGLGLGYDKMTEPRSMRFIPGTASAAACTLRYTLLLLSYTPNASSIITTAP